MSWIPARGVGCTNSLDLACLPQHYPPTDQSIVAFDQKAKASKRSREWCKFLVGLFTKVLERLEADIFNTAGSNLPAVWRSYLAEANGKNRKALYEEATVMDGVVSGRPYTL